jgi:DNA-binding response OmpR family regulator
MTKKILIVDDDKKNVELIHLYLKQDNYVVFTAYDGREALELARSKQLDLIILDLMLPKVDGLDVCRILRMERSDIPIIMLTARTTEDDKLLGLDLGADDYVTKPFSPRELAARVRAVLRRINGHGERDMEKLAVGDLEIDFMRHEVRIKGQQVNLTPREFKLLETLARSPGRVYTRFDLMEQAFGYDYDGLERTIDAHIMNLRKKIEDDHSEPRYVQTVFGVGYKFAEGES